MTKNVLGIDFGTAYTYICQYDGQVYKNVGEEFATGIKMRYAKGSVLKKSPGIPTLIGVQIDTKTGKEEWIVGKELKNVLDQPDAIIKNIQGEENGFIMESVCYNNEIIYYCDNLKQLLREQSLPLDWELDKLLFYGQNNDKFITIIDLAKKFFETIIPQDIYNNSNTIAIGVPGKDKNSVNLENYKSRIQQIFKKEKEKLVIVEEPVAAAIAYCKYNKMRTGNYLVIDIGGGTSDFSLICHDQSFELRDTDGNNHPAGNDLDDSITVLTDEDVSKNLKIEVTKAKEKLFSSDGGENTADFNYNGKTISLTCKRKNFESKIEKVVNILGSVNDFAKDISTNIKKWNNCFNELEGILYVGGTSNIKHLRDTIKYQLNLSGINEYYFTDQKVLDTGGGKGKEIELTYANAVAVGAALYALDQQLDTKKYNIKAVPKLELIIQKDKMVTLLDQEMITDSRNLTKENREKGPYILSSNDCNIRILKDGQPFPNPQDDILNYPLGEKFDEGSEIILLADSFEEDQDVTSIVACDLDWLAENDYMYVYKLNDGAFATLDFKENKKNTGSKKNSGSKSGNKVGKVYKLTKKNWVDLTVKDLSTFGFKKKNA